ncbi:tyrosine-type recombinase/integrase [Bradyrhizobium yuanmingense]|uniref:tyrosine-type recombinase/integrase n=1 Tax=Bradyrhizobium yuanmingense TaxID=108015 RepID=UPI0009DA5F7A
MTYRKAEQTARDRWEYQRPRTGSCKIAADAPAFILTERGKPYSDKSFTGKFSAWGKAAGITTQCSPHTLRFAAARRLAELGLSLKVIASITGHDSLKEL